MKIISFRGQNGPHTGALVAEGQEILDFDTPQSGLPTRASAFSWVDMGGPHFSAAQQLVDRLSGETGLLEELRGSRAVLPKSSVKLLSPVPRPGKVICIGLNYKDHAAESGLEPPEAPLCFSKFSSSVIGSGEQVVLPPGSDQNDYEAELGIVIGRLARRVEEAEALDYVLGYTNVNDVSARDFQFSDGQWQRGKSPDTFCPVGEYIATKEEIPSPEQLPIRLQLNGQTMQDSNTDQLIFGVAKLVSYLSMFTTLEPGDLIASGTPPGVGFARKPPIYIQPGDVMQVEIDGLGVLSNPVTR